MDIETPKIKLPQQEISNAQSSKLPVFDGSCFGVDVKIDYNDLESLGYESNLLDLDDDNIYDAKEFIKESQDGTLLGRIFANIDSNGEFVSYSSLYFSSEHIDGKYTDFQVKDYNSDGLFDICFFDNFSDGTNISEEYIFQEDGSAQKNTSITNITYDENQRAVSNVCELDMYSDGTIDEITQSEYTYYENGQVKTSDLVTQIEDGTIIDVRNYMYYENGNLKAYTIKNDFNYDGKNDSIIISNFYEEEGTLQDSSFYSDRDYDGTLDKMYYVAYDKSGKKTLEQEQIDDNNDNKYDSIYTKRYENGVPVEETYFENYDINKEIDDYFQGSIGDCWLLAGLDALSNSSYGREVIKNAITINDDNTYSVYFKGIDETFNISEEELNNARMTKKYSSGDDDVLLMEVAFEKAFQDMEKRELNKSLIERLVDYLFTGQNEIEESSLNGGHFEYVTQMLMGKSPKTLDSSKKIGEILEQYEQNPNNLSLFVSFFSEETGNYTMGDIYGNVVVLSKDTSHAWSISKVDDNYVTMVNPWNTKEEIVVYKKDFLEKVSTLSYFDFTL
ncbi:hypothetical protein IJX73_03615 [bacterium]|nr:hypothetical protein [bacterium]